MKILAILQNQWFKNPERIAAMYARHVAERGLDGRAQLNRVFLFYKSVTGKRLRAAFGDLCDQIIWEEASATLGGHSSAAPPADPAHIVTVLRHHQPDVILTFGTIASNGLAAATPGGQLDGRSFVILHAPHPAARQPGVGDALLRMAADLRRGLAYAEVHGA